VDVTKRKSSIKNRSDPDLWQKIELRKRKTNEEPIVRKFLKGKYYTGFSFGTLAHSELVQTPYNSISSSAKNNLLIIISHF
jgi:hypothetical protein